MGAAESTGNDPASLRFLSRGPVSVTKAAVEEKLLLDGGERGSVSVDRRVLKAMVEQGTLRLSGGSLALNQAGGRREGTASQFQDQHRDLGAVAVELGNGRETATVNWSESPLGQLMRRKSRDGKPFLSGEEYQAGERLRADFTRGQMMPRLGANWEASVASGRRAGGVAELTDAALAARLRVEHAIGAVGPELSGILIDVCCFLKGMETVEIERGWPARSAKVVLKAALGVLSRHYDPRPSTRAEGRPRTLHWGASDYRPSIG